MAAGIEIERKYLLRAVPTKLPDAMQRLEIEQGYIEADHVPHASATNTAEHIREGRLRKTVYPDGKVVYKHTIKRGFGLVREEIERVIDMEEFERLWPATQGMRLRKARWRMMEGRAIIAIDVFKDINLALAEIEAPSLEQMIPPPEWLEPYIEREVTEEREFVNSEIARRIGTG